MDTRTTSPAVPDDALRESVLDGPAAAGAEPPETGGRRARLSLSDEQGEALLRRFSAGEVAALDILIEAYSATIYAILLRWYRLSVEDAEDLFQEVLLQLTVKAAEIRNPRRWLVGTTINQARKRIRRLVRDRKLADRYGEELLLHEAPEPEDDRDLIRRGMARLRAFDRTSRASATRRPPSVSSARSARSDRCAGVRSSGSGTPSRRSRRYHTPPAERGESEPERRPGHSPEAQRLGTGGACGPGRSRCRPRGS